MPEPQHVCTATRSIPFTAYRTWGVLSDFDIGNWHPDVQRCDLTARGSNAERKVYLKDSIQHDRLVQLGARALEYVVLSTVMPILGYKGFISIDDHGTGAAQCDATWRLEFDFKIEVDLHQREALLLKLNKWISAGLDNVEAVLAGKPRACAIETTEDGKLVPKDEIQLGLPRNTGVKSKPNPNKGAPLEWDFENGFPLKRVIRRLSIDLLPFQTEFLAFAIEHGILKFGDFPMHGRTMPYQFCPEMFVSGKLYGLLGTFFAKSLLNVAVEYDTVCGPDLELPHVVSIVTALAEAGIEKQFCLTRPNRKNESGVQFINGNIDGRILFITDHVFQGGRLREALKSLRAQGGKLGGLVVALDCQERGASESTSEVRGLEAELGVPIHSIVCLNHVFEYIAALPGYEEHAAKLKEYIFQYCVV